MSFTSKSLKAQAWKSMRNTAPPAFLVTLLYLVLTDVLNNLLSLLMPGFTLENLIYDQNAGIWTTLFLSVLTTIFTAVMQFGYSCWALRTSRDENPGLGTLLDGFGMVGRVLFMEARIFLSVFFWTMLMSMAYLFTAMIVVYLSPILVVVLTVIFYVGLLAFMLRYELAPFLLCDYPDAGSGAAVRRSVEMMRGHIWDLIKLHLSFWPWYLLYILIGLVVSGVALIPMIGELTQLFRAGSMDVLRTQLQLALSGTLATILLMLTTIPIDLFFRPYRQIAMANFYRALSYEPAESSFSGETF